MALKDTDIKRYQEMTRAELQAKAAEIEQMRERPKAAVGFGSRLWTFTKTLGLAAIGAVVGQWLGGKLGKTEFGQKNVIGKFISGNKRTIGAGLVAAAGVSTMRGNRAGEVQDKADLELAKIQAVLAEREQAMQFQPQITAQDMAAMNHAHQHGHAVGQHTERALSGRGGQQLGV